MTTLNWQELMDNAGGSAEPLPPGDYDVAVNTCEPAQTQNGKLMFKTTMRVLAGPHAGRTIWNNFVISPESPGAMGYFFQHMAILGLDRSFFAQQPQPPHIAQAMLGRACTVTVAHRMYQNQVRMEVTKITMPTPGLVVQQPLAAAPAPAMAVPQPAPVPAPAAAVPPPAPAPVAVSQPMPQPEGATVIQMPVAQPEPQYEQPAPAPIPQPQYEQPAPAPAPAPVQYEQPVAPAPAPVQEQAPAGAPMPVPTPPF